MRRESVTQKNSQFWNELCGSTLARRLGVRDHGQDSLRRYDEWYFSFYPYLDRHIPFTHLRGKRILEIGLGYGSVAQRLAQSGVLYTGLDAAFAPVTMVRHRLRQWDLGGTVVQGDILMPPFQRESFDYIVAIGCFHHTGDVSLALARAHELLVPGGGATIMVYNAHSYRRWTRFLPEAIGLSRSHLDSGASASARAAYDASFDGSPAPFTEFVSASTLKRLAAAYSSCDITKENADHEVFGVPLGPRAIWLKTIGHICGLDLYARLVK